MSETKRALIVVDVQNDFCEGGSLAVTGGAAVATNVGARLARASSAGYSAVVATKDHHIDPGSHWSESPDFKDTWPRHCEVGTEGEEFHPNLQPRPFDAVFVKGKYEAAYSGFEGFAEDGAGLASWLAEHQITEVDVCGIATDYCVKATALDAVAAGLRTRLLLDLCAGVAPESTEAALAQMRDAGVEVFAG